MLWSPESLKLWVKFPQFDRPWQVIIEDADSETPDHINAAADQEYGLV